MLPGSDRPIILINQGVSMRIASILAAFSMLLLMAGVALAQNRPDNPASDLPLLTVTGTGEVAVAPDRATLRLGAVVQADQAADAQTKVSATVQKTLAALKDLGIPAADITTAGVSLNPVYSQPVPRRAANSDEPFTPKITAYRASNTLEIRLSDLKKVGPAIDAAVTAGADQVQSIDFDLKDDSAARSQALANAVKQARAKAQAIADAANISLVAIHDIEESNTGGGVVPYMGNMRAMVAAAPTPVEPGQLHLSASVVFRYTITPAAK